MMDWKEQYGVWHKKGPKEDPGNYKPVNAREGHRADDLE